MSQVCIIFFFHVTHKLNNLLKIYKNTKKSLEIQSKLFYLFIFLSYADSAEIFFFSISISIFIYLFFLTLSTFKHNCFIVFLTYFLCYCFPKFPTKENSADLSGNLPRLFLFTIKVSSFQNYHLGFQDFFIRVEFQKGFQKP